MWFSGFFYGGFWAVASSLLSDHWGYVNIGLVLLWIEIFLYLFPPASLQGPLLLFWDWFALFAPKYVQLLPERYDGCVLFIFAYYCLYRWTWYLQAFGNCSQGWSRLVDIKKKKNSEVLADLFWFAHDVKQRGTEFEGRPSFSVIFQAV